MIPHYHLSIYNVTDSFMQFTSQYLFYDEMRLQLRVLLLRNRCQVRVSISSIDRDRVKDIATLLNTKNYTENGILNDFPFQVNFDVPLIDDETGKKIPLGYFIAKL